MNITKLLPASLLCIACLGSAQAQNLFVRGGLELINPTGADHYRDTAGSVLAFGTTFGEAKNDEIALEISGFHLSEPNYNTTWNGTSGSVTIDKNNGKITITFSGGPTVNATYRPSLNVCPVLASYRHYFGARDARVRFYVGAAAGFSNVKATGSNWMSSRSDSDYTWNPTWNASAGVSFWVIPTLSLDAGYAYQDIKGSTLTWNHSDYRIQSIRTNLFQVTACWHF